MKIIKRFAHDGSALDDCMELVEVLKQLLDEQPVTDLHSGDTRVIHVVGEPKNDVGV